MEQSSSFYIRMLMYTAIRYNREHLDSILTYQGKESKA
jgi:hypothetical protein